MHIRSRGYRNGAAWRLPSKTVIHERPSARKRGGGKKKKSAHTLNPNPTIAISKSVSIAQRLAYFDAMVTPVACFASGHRKIYKQDLRKLDVKFRKLVRTIAGPPGGLDWSAPWHHILHEWNARALECAEQAGVKLWSRRCLEQHWKLANYIANLPDNRWLKRALAWTAGRRRRIGRPTNTWDAQIQMYCRWRNLGEWRATAMQTEFWLTHMDSFIEFATPK